MSTNEERDHADLTRGRPVWVLAFEQPTEGAHPLVYVPRYMGLGTTIHVRRKNVKERLP